MNQIVTPREEQVMELISYGLAQKEIADVLGCSINTVDTHVKNIKKKTGLQKSGEVSLAYIYKKYKLPLCNLPELIRKRIAQAFLALTLFSVVLSSSDFLRVLRPINRVVRTAARPGARRGGRKGNSFKLNVA